MKILRQQDIKTLRDKWLKDQNYIDPLTGLKIVKPTLDHCHLTGHCRQVLDFNSNQFEGKVVSAYRRFLKFTKVPISNILINLIGYLSYDYSSNPIHPQTIRQNIKKFSRRTVREQVQILKEIGIKVKDIQITKVGRKKQYSQFLKRKENILKF